MQGVEQVIRNEDKLAQEDTTTANQRFTEPRVLQSSQTRKLYVRHGARVALEEYRRRTTSE